MSTLVTGAFGCIGAWVVRDLLGDGDGASAAIADVVGLIDDAWPAAKGLISHVEEPIPFPDALDDARYQKDLGPAVATPLEAGVRRTLEEFARLQKEGRLDARELG
jgi:dTDP-D-glucose 4,6-dehydratase